MKNQKRLHLIYVLTVFFSFGSLSAQEFTAGINTETPNPNAVLHLVSPNNDQGLLIPALTNAQRTSLSLTTTDEGLLVFDSEDGAFYFWDGGGWVALNVPANLADGVDWTELTGIPADIDDGDNQDLTLTGNTLAISGDPNTDVDLTPYLDDQTVSLADGGSGNVTIGGTYPSFTIDVPAATDEQDLTLTGNTLAISGDPNTDVDLTPYLDDQTVSLADGGSGNVTIGGTYPSFTIDVPAATDEQDLTLTGNTLAISGDPNTDVDLTPYLDDQTVSLADGGSGNVTIGGTYPSFTIDVAGGTDEQDLTLTGNTLAISGDPNTDVDLTPYLDDQTVSLADGGSGNVTIGGTYPSFTIDVPAATDEQDLTLTGNTLAISGDPNTDVDLTPYLDDQTVSLADGGSGNVTIGGTYPSFTIDVAGGTDEQDLTLTGNTLAISGDPNTDVDLTPYLDDQTVSLADGGSGNVTIGGTYPSFTIDVAGGTDEQDLTLTGNTLAISGDPNTDVDLSFNAPTDGDVLTWDNTNSRWDASAPTSLASGNGITVSGSNIDLGGTLTAPATITTGAGSNDLTIGGAGRFISDAAIETSLNSPVINLGDAATDDIRVNGEFNFETGANDLALVVTTQTATTPILRIPDLPSSDETLALVSDLASLGVVSEPNATSIVGGTGSAGSMTGTDNTIYGVNAATTLVAGSDNTIIGSGANVITGATANTVVVGSGATSDALRGVAIGDISAVSANDAIAIGHNAQATAEGAIALGDNIIAGQANSIILGNTSDGYRVGIGTASPAVTLDVLATDAIRLPKGDDAARPSGLSATDAGLLRYSDEPGAEGFEGFDGSVWKAIGGSDLIDNPLNQNLVAGFGAGSSLVSGGDRNVFVGENAGSGVTTGTDNVLIGRNAGLTQTTGVRNTLIGSGAATSATSQNVIGIGANSNVPGDGSIAIGFNTQANNLDGIALGRGAQSNADDAIAVGTLTNATNANTIILGDGVNSNYSVGISTQNPRAPFQIGEELSMGFFQNATEGIDGNAILSNLYPDYTNAADNELRRSNTDSSSFIFFDDGEIIFLNAPNGAADSPLDLSNGGDVRSWLIMKNDGNVDISEGIKIGSPDPGDEEDGMIRYTGSAFEGYNSGSWSPLGGGLTLPFVQSQTDAGPLLDIQNTGAGQAARFRSTGGDAVEIEGNVSFFDQADRSIAIYDNTTGPGNNMALSAGNSTSGSADPGGNLYLNAGDGDPSGGNGGDVVISAGIPGGAAFPGIIETHGVIRVDNPNSGVGGTLELEDDGGANAFVLQAHPSSDAYTVILPQSQAGGALTNDGSGNLSWSSGGLTLPYTDSGSDPSNAVFDIQNLSGTAPGAAFGNSAATEPALRTYTDAGGSAGGIGFSGQDALTDYQNAAVIRGEVTDNAAATFSGELIFETRDGGVFQESMRMLQNGDIVFPNTSDKDVSVAAATSGAGHALTLNAGDGDGVAGDGGALFLNAGEGFDFGGNTTISAGNATNASGIGGNVILTPGNSGNPANRGIVDITGPTALKVPVGNDSEKPGTPLDGMIRYNTTLSAFEGYENGAWVNLVGGAGISGTANRIPKINATGDGLADSQMFSNGVNNQITVQHTATSIADFVIHDAGLGDASLQFNRGGTAFFSVGVDYDDSDNFKISSGTDVTSNEFVIERTSGNVGIGINAPAREFHLNNGAGGISLQMTNAASAGVTQTNGFVIDYNDTDQTVDFRHYEDADIALGNSSTRQLYIDNTGNRVGIGTATPTNTLDINGDVGVASNVVLGGNLISAISGPFSADPVASDSRIITLDGGPISDIAVGQQGQEIILVSQAAGVDIIDADNGGINIQLSNNDTNFTMNVNATLHLVYVGSFWIEIGRSAQL